MTMSLPKLNFDQKVNQRQNTICLEQQTNVSPENFMPTLLVLFETFRMSAAVYIICMTRYDFKYICLKQSIYCEHLWQIQFF